LAIWGEETPGAILTKCGIWGDMVDVITYAIFGDRQLRGVVVVRGVILPFPIDFRCRPYNTGHRVMAFVCHLIKGMYKCMHVCTYAYATKKTVSAFSPFSSMTFTFDLCRIPV